MDIEHQVNELLNRVAALEAAVMKQMAPMPTPATTPGPTFAPATTVLTAVVTEPEGTYQPAPPSGQPAPLAGPIPPPPDFAPAAAPKPAAFEGGIETILRWAGVVLVSLAGIFLVSTAISRAWIGPELQLVGAALAGAGLLGAAVRLAATRTEWSLAFGAGGAVVLAASSLATHEWLEIVGPGVAVALLGFVTVVSISVALHTRIEVIALTATVVGMLAPIRNLSEYGDATILGWVVAFILGSSALGLANTWPGVRLITAWLGALVLVAYSLGEDVSGAMQAIALLGALLIATVLWAAPSLAHRLSTTGGPGTWGSFDWKAIDYRLVAFVPAWTWLVLAALFTPGESRTVGFAAIATALVFATVVATLWSLIPRLISISTIFGVLSLVAVGFAILLDGPALMIAWAGQAITSYYLSRQLDDRALRANAYLVGLVATALAALEMLDAVGNDGFPNVGYAVATLVIVVGWVGAAGVAYRRQDRTMPFEPPFLGAWTGTMLWLGAALIGVSQGLVLISVTWTGMACAGLVFGLRERSGVVKNAAMCTLGITLFKLVTLDMAEVDIFWRVGLFFVVGMGLIALGLKVPSLIGPAAGADQQGLARPADKVTTF